ncbi:MAG: efflux RND transporter periplasmic adaptor subunit [Verrucomicrobia bacterium]|nr:efflux RND transporter periplasmic adaptor subunit [Verrucomicrobiota bacterium]
MNIRFVTPVARPLSVLFLGLAAALPLGAQTPAGPAEVRTARPERGEIHRYVTLPGTLRANLQATLYPKIAGYLKSVAVDKGDRVRAGQPLAEIEVPELIAEQTRYRAEVEVAEAAAQRVNTAFSKSPDLITPSAVDEAKARVRIAQANLDRVETLLKYCQINAPFAGTITMRFADPGAFVAAPSAGGSAQNAALFTLMDFSVVRVYLPVPEFEASRVQVDQPVKVSVEGIPGKIYSGGVTRFGYVLDEATRTMLVEADIPNPGGELRPGMYAKVRIGVERHRDALLIPAGALVMERAAASAFVVADGKAQKIPLTVGFNDGEHVEVLKGLEAGQAVILVGKLALAPGQPVKVVESR